MLPYTLDSSIGPAFVLFSHSSDGRSRSLLALIHSTRYCAFPHIRSLQYVSQSLHIEVPIETARSVISTSRQASLCWKGRWLMCRNYVQLEKLGEGTYATVYKVSHSHT